MSQVNIEINSGSDILDATLLAKLKNYAIKNFGWKEEIPDPNWVFDPEQPEIQEAPLIANPITFIQAIFVDYPMAQFWVWEEEQVRRNAVVDEVVTLRESTTTAVVVEE